MDMVMLTARGFHFDRVDETPDVVRMNDPVSWAGMCHPPSSIDAILFGGGSVGAMGILNGACLLLVDEAVPLDQMTALGIPYIYLELVEFPGPNEEYVLKISTNIPNINAVSVVFPSGAQITAHLPFPGTGCGIGPPNQINCGNPTPWLPVSETRQANMRFAAELGDGAEVTVFYSTDYGMHYDPGGFVRVYSGGPEPFGRPLARGPSGAHARLAALPGEATGHSIGGSPAMKQWQKYLAEVFGTFVLVFIGTTTLIASGGLGGAALFLAPFGFGLALLAGLYAFGEVSGGHFNPAVSLAMYLDRRLEARDLIGYWLSQFVGAILASLVVLLAFHKQAAVASTATLPSTDGRALVFEIVLTAVFVAVILQATRSGKYGSSALVAIPLTLLTIHLAALPFSGSSVNPARTLGPALVGWKWDSEWIYFVGPALGAILGWIVHTVVVKGDTSLGDDIARVRTDLGGATG